MENQDENVAQQRKNFIGKLLKEVKADKKHHGPAFKEMRDNMRLAREGAENEWVKGNKYIVNIIHRHIQQRKSSLYAKNPKATAKRRPRMDFAVWDEKPESLIEAMQVIQQAGQAGIEPPPTAIAVIRDYERGMQERRMITKIGRTMELCFHYYLDEQAPVFKTSAKHLVGRVLTCAVGYIKHGFDRVMDMSPDKLNRIADLTNKVAHMERLVKDVEEDEIHEDAAELEEMKMTLEALQADKDVIIKEGPVYDFPRSTSVIPDRHCYSLAGWLGADRVSQEYAFTPDQIKEIYKVDVGKKYLRYKPDGSRSMVRTDTDAELAMVFEIYDKTTGRMYTVCDGYQDFLEEPRKPNVEIEQFFPYQALTFNDVESESELFPHSDVYYLRHQQAEMNRMGEGLREHRQAARPRYVASKGAFDDDDTAIIANTAPHHVALLNALTPGQKLGDLIDRMPVANIDMNVYSTAQAFEDVLRSVGSQEANLGGTGGATATESSIAESSRLSSQSSNVDDLDDFLTAMARVSGQVMLAELDKETVVQIAGPGAVWPEMSNQEIADEVHLEIKAGSSGRPNKAQEMANFERVAPFLLQTPGITPGWMAKHMIQLIDDSLDYTEAITEGLPSITAQNGAVQPGTGDAATDPNQQGGQGANNKPGVTQGNEGPQPAFPQA